MKRIKERYVTETSEEAGGHWLIWRPHNNDRRFYICKGERAHKNESHISLRRLIYLIEHKEIPHGCMIKSLCGVPNCVNPTHIDTWAKMYRSNNE